MPVSYGENLTKLLKDSGIPNYVIPEGANVNTDGVAVPSTEVGSYNPTKAPTVLNWYDKNPNTLIHEAEHMRQTFVGDVGVPSKIQKERISTGALGDDNYWKLVDKLKTVPTHDLVTKYDFGTNYGDNPQELFANLTAYKVQHESKGIEFTKTPLGKFLGVEKGSDMSAYIHTHTLIGQDKLYETNKPPTMSERLLSIINGLTK